MDLARALSPEQFDAATCLQAPVCILAGAGSGKTRVITHRIAWLLDDKRAHPESILAVTFTNKAAGEMRARVEALVPGRGARVQMGTFHGVAARMLRRYGRIVGVNPSFVIYDADDADRLLARILENDLNLSKDTTRAISSLIDGWQSEGLLPDDVPKGHEFLFEHALAAYRLYTKKLDDTGALDFGGLLMKMRALLRSDDGAVLRRAIRHVLVDEYQDVSQVQADIVLALAREADSVAVVGDDDQAIYGWRGASADNLKRFLVAMPGATVRKLEENYRSTTQILDAANGIIAHNEIRLGKTLRPAQGRDGTTSTGRRVRLLRGRDDLDEARRVMNLALEHVGAGESLDEIAVLYRTNAMSRLFEDELRRHSLPYRVVGGVRFYDRKEVKDVLATLRAALVPRSDVDFLRHLQAVPRGVGAASLEKIDGVARRSGRSLQQVFGDDKLLTEAGLAERARKRCLEVAGALSTLAGKIGRPAGAQPTLFSSAAPLGAKDAIALAVEASGVAERLEAEGGVEAEGRLENLQELVSAAANFEEEARRQGTVADVEAFLETAALLGSADDGKDDDGGRGKVTLMTLHAAKGLEFDIVFLCGLEEHGFPHSRAIVDGAPRSELEEERRLAYVGITRARRRLVLSYADWRMVQGQKKRRDPSRFLYEIPRDVLEGDVPARTRHADADLWPTRALRSDDDVIDDGDDGNASSSRIPARALPGPRIVYDDDGVRPPRPSRTRLVLDDGAGPTAGGGGGFGRSNVAHDGGLHVDGADASIVRPIARRFALGMRKLADDVLDAAPEAPAAASFAEGARVRHTHFGSGVVVGMRGAGRNQAALVRFDAERSPRVIIARHLARDDE